MNNDPFIIVLTMVRTWLTQRNAILNNPILNIRLKQFLGYQSEVRQSPHFYGTRVNVTGQNPKKPESIEEAVSGFEKLKWQKAMEVEVQSLEENVWDLVELPEGKEL